MSPSLLVSPRSVLVRKGELNYKLIYGMRAVGNQCQDCAHYQEDLSCDVLRAIVNPKAHCDRFQDPVQS